MIVLDTNVISELTKPTPAPSVVAWVDAQSSDELWTTTINVFEVRFGLVKMPIGKKRRELTAAFEAMLRNDLLGRVLDFDQMAAEEAATISGKLRAMGRPIDIRDSLIAGTVAAQPGASLATRNVKHFADTGVSLVDPWSAVSP